ncbi:MAG: hypothetical protein K6G88_06500 [Lachnospiraceae bacterium]|nr:hypothetical protein [Lachnospiraceae bacterium]
MKKKYDYPEIELIKFDSREVLMTDFGSDFGDGDDKEWDLVSQQETDVDDLFPIQ